jgi:hypothetical protein
MEEWRKSRRGRMERAVVRMDMIVALLSLLLLLLLLLVFVFQIGSLVGGGTGVREEKF